MFQSWLKRQIILAAILVPLASLIFIISAFIINQISQQQVIVLNVSLLITLIILVAIFIRLYQIKFFEITKKKITKKILGNFQTSSLLRHSTLSLLIVISSAVIFTIAFKLERDLIYIAIIIHRLLIDKTRINQTNKSDETENN